MDLHAEQIQGFTDIPFDNLEAKKPLADFICGGHDKDGMLIEDHVPDPLFKDFVIDKKDPDLVILAPDSGGLGRAKKFRNESAGLCAQQRIRIVPEKICRVLQPHWY